MGGEGQVGGGVGVGQVRLGGRGRGEAAAQGGGEQGGEVVVVVGQHPRVGGDPLPHRPRPLAAHQQHHVRPNLALEQRGERALVDGVGGARDTRQGRHGCGAPQGEAQAGEAGETQAGDALQDHRRVTVREWAARSKDWGSWYKSFSSSSSSSCLLRTWKLCY